MTNLLPLETWRSLMQFHPFHFWGWSNSTIPVTSNCDDLVREYAYQSTDRGGRAEVRTAIATAEQRLFDYLGYRVAPTYTEAIVPWPTPADQRLTRLIPSDPRGHWLSQQLPEGHVQALGVEALTLIATANVAYSDEDGDGLTETFTISAATSVTDTDQIAVYFSVGDRFDDTTVGPRWRVQPVHVAISGGVVTITGRSWLLARPILYQGFAQSLGGLDPDVSSNFAQTLDIYWRRTNNSGTTTADSQAVVEWETYPGWWWGWCTDGTTNDDTNAADPAAIARAVARGGIRNSDLGIVHAAEAVYNSAADQWYAKTTYPWAGWEGCPAEPDRVTIRYLAGYPLAQGQMAPRWQAIVARLAAAELARAICACEATNRELYHWQFDVAKTGASDELFGAVSAEDLNNPFGTRRGHIYAWRQVKNLRQIYATTI